MSEVVSHPARDRHHGRDQCSQQMNSRKAWRRWVRPSASWIQATQQNAALVEEMAAAASSLKGQANELVQAVAFFKLRAGQALARPAMPLLRRHRRASSSWWRPPQTCVQNLRSNPHPNLCGPRHLWPWGRPSLLPSPRPRRMTRAGKRLSYYCPGVGIACSNCTSCRKATQGGRFTYRRAVSGEVAQRMVTPAAVAQPSHTVPTGLSALPPPGPAIPVTATAIWAWECARAPCAMARTTVR